VGGTDLRHDVHFVFADHTLDTDRRELCCGSQPVAVEPQVFDLLVYLVQNRDRVVSKDDLIASVWKGRIVSESTLTSRINATRTAIGDNGKEQKLIRTVARKGIRFVGIVHEEPTGVEQARLPDPADEVGPRPISLPLSERPAIAVLPFTNMSDDPEQEYFSDGISEDIITALSRLRWFLVIARNSSFVYKGKAVHMKQIAEELGVDYVVEGSVRKSGEQVRITAQLNDVATGSHIWAEHYDRDLTDVFAVQDGITESIVAAIEPQLYAAESFRARRKLPDSMDAWDLVMRALSYYWRVTRQDNVVAQALLEKAIAIDPNYGQALGVLATSQTFSAHMGWANMATTIPIAERAALAAILADSEDPWAHNALGCVYLFTRRFDDSLAEFELALRLNPSFSLAQGYYGLALSYCGYWEEADLAAQRALRLSPRDPFSAIYCGIAAYAQFVGHNYDEAMRLSREALRQRSDFVGAHRVLTAAAGMAGHREASSVALQELRRAQPNISLAWIATEMPMGRDVDKEHYLEGFRRAGLE
jgi:TolB-like protein